MHEFLPQIPYIVIYLHDILVIYASQILSTTSSRWAPSSAHRAAGLTMIRAGARSAEHSSVQVLVVEMKVEMQSGGGCCWSTERWWLALEIGVQ